MLRIAENAKKTSIFFLVLGVPTYGEGGSTWLGQKTKFFDRFNLKAPLTAKEMAIDSSSYKKS